MDLSVLSIPLPEDLMKLKWNGQFELMKEMINLRIQKDIPSQLKERLILEKNILDDLKEEFIYTREQALDILKDKISNFQEEEFDALFKDNAFEFLFIEGTMMFKNDLNITLKNKSNLDLTKPKK